MSRLQELISRLCPDGVPFKPLGVLVKINRGTRLTKDQLEEKEGYPVYQNSLIPLGFYARWNCKGKNPFVIAAGAAGDIGFTDMDFWAADDCYYFTNYTNLLPKFLFYWLLNNQHTIKGKVRRASIPRISREEISKIIIAVPPIEVQEEIVRILDSFSDYAAELQAELQARREQYEYYRNLLLTFSPSACGFGTDDKQEKDDVTTWGGA